LLLVSGDVHLFICIPFILSADLSSLVLISLQLFALCPEKQTKSIAITALAAETVVTSSSSRGNRNIVASMGRNQLQKKQQQLSSSGSGGGGGLIQQQHSGDISVASVTA
jgi:hypothetical protein